MNQAVVMSERRLGFLEHLRAESQELIKLAGGLTEDLMASVCDYNMSYKRFSHLSEEMRQKMNQIREQLHTLNNLDVSLVIISHLGWRSPRRGKVGVRTRTH